MKKYKIYFLLFTISSNTLISQNLADKKVLVVWGGWDGHKPELFSIKLCYSLWIKLSF